jgi:hypothetical protein
MIGAARQAIRRPTWLPWVVAALALTGAGVLWLTQSSALAATGRRIARLELRRQELAQRRSAGLIALAAATDPQRLEARALALGFGPAERVEYLTVPAPADPDPGAGTVAGLDAASPLAIVLRNESREPPAAPGEMVRLLSKQARPAEAAGRRPAEASP